MFQMSRHFFLLTLLVLGEYALFKSSAVLIDYDVFECTIPCNTATFHCDGSGMEVEWLNSDNVVINSFTDTGMQAIPSTGLLVITDPQVTDSGIYTCRAKANHSDYDEVTLTITKPPTFISGNGFVYEEKTALRYTDVFINCSVDPIDAYTSWEFKNTRIHHYDNDKYSLNNSGLIIHNVTAEDQGHYVCFLGNVDPINATILLNVIWPPQLSLPQNRTVEVNVSEEVVLNCTASSSPDPVYSWLIIPDSCSSCPKYSNDSIINFTANISSKGDYICAAKNDYGTATKRVTINVLSKPLIATEFARIIMKERKNILLTCDVQYAYPLPIIEWYIMTPLSDEYTLIQNNSTNYKLHNNGSIEMLHRFLFEMGHVKVKCLATNIHGSGIRYFDLWENEIFMRKQEFKVYIDNITNCEDLKNKDRTLFRKLVDSLREWFDSACQDYCNGHNNLFTPQMTCLTSHVGIVNSTVHHEGENSAQHLIDLAVADVQARHPPVVHLSQGWILRLNLSSSEKSSNSKSQSAIIGVSIGVAIIVIVIILLSLAGISFGIYKRYLILKKNDSKDNGKTERHIYDEVGIGYVCKSQSAHSSCKDDNVIFEVSTSQTPAYQSLSKSLDDKYGKPRNEKYNDYYIDGEDNLKTENIYKEGTYPTDYYEKELQNDHAYNKLMHLKQ